MDGENILKVEDNTTNNMGSINPYRDHINKRYILFAQKSKANNNS